MRQLAVLVALTLVSCIGGGGQTQRGVPSVKSAIVESDDYSTKNFVGLSTPDEAVNMAFKVSGQVERVPVAKGMVVAKGELLAQLDARDFELQLMADRSAYEQAKSRYQRVERLLEHEAVSRAEAEAAQAEYIKLSTMYENAKDLLTETKLRAPFKALVERVYVDTYQRIQSGERIIRLVSPTSSTVEFTLPESSLFAFLEPSTLFQVRFDIYENVVFDARIKEYAQTSSDASGLPVALTITNVGDYNIQSGMSCSIAMMILQGSSSSVTIPLSAIYAPTQGGNFVWIIDADQRVSLQPIVLGELTGQNQVVVTGGVKAGNRVVTAGVYKLREGDKVKIIEGL